MDVKPIDFLSKKSFKRECGECHACCTVLKVNVYGHMVDKGNPCPHIKENRCGIYERRPNACKEYTCHWLNNLDIPDWMQPLKSRVILTDKYHDGHYYIMMTEVDDKVDSYILNQVIQYIFNTGRNLEYSVNQKTYHLGSPEFIEMIQKELINK